MVRRESMYVLVARVGLFSDSYNTHRNKSNHFFIIAKIKLKEDKKDLKQTNKQTNEQFTFHQGLRVEAPEEDSNSKATWARAFRLGSFSAVVTLLVLVTAASALRFGESGASLLGGK